MSGAILHVKCIIRLLDIQLLKVRLFKLQLETGVSDSLLDLFSRNRRRTTRLRFRCIIMMIDDDLSRAWRGNHVNIKFVWFLSDHSLIWGLISRRHFSRHILVLFSRRNQIINGQSSRLNLTENYLVGCFGRIALRRQQRKIMPHRIWRKKLSPGAFYLFCCPIGRQRLLFHGVVERDWTIRVFAVFLFSPMGQSRPDVLVYGVHIRIRFFQLSLGVQNRALFYENLVEFYLVFLS